ncbi:MAG: hypothetical protein HQL28_07200, partial [Candidatus Omnitrophica bacterium]|nr:hypothetical protein [Candidatus Omnitrophota bacterium]
MSKEKNEKNVAGKILKNVSYGTGIFCRKVMEIGKVTETKKWKEVSKSAEHLCGTIGEKTKDAFEKVKKTVDQSVEDIKESFEEGMESLGAKGEEKKETKKNKVEIKVKTEAAKEAGTAEK